MLFVEGGLPKTTDFGEVLLPDQASEPILAKPVRGALMEWLTEIWAAKELVAVNLKPRKRALFHGAPGTGKTTLAHHLAARLGLPLLIVRPERIQGQYMSQSAQAIGRLFDALAAESDPVFLFFDEFDSLATKRQVGAASSAAIDHNHTVNTLLANFDRFDGFVVAATNLGGDLDPAVWRRFELQIELALPGDHERRRILERYFAPFVLPELALAALSASMETASPALMRAFAEHIKRQIVVGPKAGWPMDRIAVIERVIATVKPHPDLGLPRLWSVGAADRAVPALPWPLERDLSAYPPRAGIAARLDGRCRAVAGAHMNAVTQMGAVDPSALVQLVRSAAALLAGAVTAAEVLDARDHAALAYDAAKAAGRWARAKGAHDDVVSRVYRAQADSLEIESLAKRRLADEYDAAQARGEVAGPADGKLGRSNGERLPTVEDVGLSRKTIFEARRLRNAIVENPGIVRGALDDLLSRGDEPTRTALKRVLVDGRANLRAAVGTDTATAAERGDNFYQTPVEAVRVLLALESFSSTVLEPACGKGAISRPLEEAGYEVVLSDIRDRECASRDGRVQHVGDFLEIGPADLWGRKRLRPDIVTNPPYGTVLNKFAAHALRVFRPRKMALLLNLNFLAGFDDPDRAFVMDECPPARVHVFSRRLPMMHREGWDGEEASSRMNTAWFVWEIGRGDDYCGPTIVNRVDWQVWERRAPLAARGRAA